MSKKYEGPSVDYEPILPETHYTYSFGKLLSWQGDPWYEVDKTWFDSVYIHAGISGFQETFQGPDAQKLLSDCSVNDVYKWKIGHCKHLVQLGVDGLITNHALFMRDAEDVFRITAGCTYPVESRLAKGGYDCTTESSDVYVFQFSGPKSLQLLEKLTQQDLRDVGFLDFRPVSIPGLDCKLEICRIGMSGTLAYELRGPKADGPTVYSAACEAGEEFGIKRMGWRDYTVDHTFGGFPQQTVHFEMSLFDDPDFRKIALNQMKCTGSVEPENHRARFRSLVEVNWDWMAKFNHEFTGRAALEAEMANPKRRTVTLVYNADDLIDIYRSQFTDDPYKLMEWPCAVEQPAGGHQDYVTTRDGKVIGYASDPTYSSHYHLTVSQAILNIDEIEEGKEVIMKWGDFGGKIKDVRATIAKFPYIHDVMDNRDYDLSTVPSGLK